MLLILLILAILILAGGFAIHWIWFLLLALLVVALFSGPRGGGYW